MRRISVGMAIMLASLAAAGSAAAKTICVPAMAAGCSSATTSLQAALQEADAAPGGNTVRIAAETYVASAGCDDNQGNHTQWTFTHKTTIVGAGVGKTILTCEAGYDNNNTYVRILSVSGPVTVSDLTITLPAGAGDRGLELGPAAEAKNVAVTTNAAATNETAVMLEGGELANSTVASATKDQNGLAVQVFGGAVTNTTVRSDGMAIEASGAATIAHARLTAPVGVSVVYGNAFVYDSLIDVSQSTGDPQPYGVGVSDSNGPATLKLTADSLTIVGSPAESVGVLSEAGAGQHVSVALSNSVIKGPVTPLERYSATASNTYADLTARYDDYPSGSYAGTGPGTTSQADILHTGPDFLNPSMGEFQPAGGSPLIDAGTPGSLAKGEPGTDLTGLPRILAGKGTCSYRRDMGAYEYATNRLPAKAAAQPTTVAPGHAVKLTATGCSIDPHLTAKFAWAFGDGHTGAGSAVSHTYAKAGTYHAIVTVSDPAGRKGTATVTVKVT